MVLLFLFAIIVLINCVYFLLFSKFSLRSKNKEAQKNYIPLSLVVYTKNQALNLKDNIPLWLEQEYPDFEIILINDASFDDSLNVMELFEENNENIKIVNVENNETFWGSKKYALTLGIKKASHQRMIFTGADCKPASNKWLNEMGAHFSSKKQIVLGYGSYFKKKGLLNKLIRFDTLLTAIQYFSFTLFGMPYMGVGRNLAYSSNVYYDNGGFVSHMEIQAGDDDLFINQAATKTNTAICFSKKSFTYSESKSSWKEWISQKKKHITTAKLYQFKHQFLLSFFYISLLLFWVFSIITLSLFDWKIPSVIILFRVVFQYIIMYHAAKKLGEKDLITWFPFLEILLIIFQFTIFIICSLPKSNSWK